jgi:hypothetical protein
MPKLSAVLNDAEYAKADDSLKTFYVQNTDTKDWWLSVDDPGKLDVAGQTAFTNLKAKLDGAYKERDAAKNALKPFEGLGKSADELKAALEANQPENVTKMVADYEAKMEALKKSFEDPLNTATEKAKKYETQVQKALTDSEIAKIVANHNLDPETAPAILRDYVRAVPKEEGSDEYVTRIFENGQPAQIAGQPMSADQLLGGWREGKKFQRMFIAGDGGGSGQGGRQISIGGGSVIQVSREASKTNPALYQNAKAQAEKTGATVQFTD